MNVKKRRWDLNPHPFEHESSPITTRPGLPPILFTDWPLVDALTTQIGYFIGFIGLRAFMELLSLPSQSCRLIKNNDIGTG